MQPGPIPWNGPFPPSIPWGYRVKNAGSQKSQVLDGSAFVSISEINVVLPTLYFYTFSTPRNVPAYALVS